jgi:hypothetical protein
VVRRASKRLSAAECDKIAATPAAADPADIVGGVNAGFANRRLNRPGMTRNGVPSRLDRPPSVRVEL